MGKRGSHSDSEGTVESNDKIKNEGRLKWVARRKRVRVRERENE